MKVGLQLYSVRDDMEKDMKGTLKKVKEMGYVRSDTNQDIMYLQFEKNLLKIEK